MTYGTLSAGSGNGSVGNPASGVVESALGGCATDVGNRDEARSDYELRVMGNRTRELQRVRRWRDDRRSVGGDEPDEQER